MSRTINLLVTGLTMPATKRLNPQLDTTLFGQTLDESIDSLKPMPGLYSQRFDFDLEAPAESPESMGAFKKAVRKGPSGGGEWDAHFIGAGLKAIPSPTPLVEELVNFVVAEAKGQPRLLFSANAADHAQVVSRRLPELQSGKESED